MTDNVGYTPGVGATVSADDVAGALVQRVKLWVSEENSSEGLSKLGNTVASGVDSGLRIHAVRFDGSPRGVATTAGNYAPIEVDENGRLWVTAAATESGIWRVLVDNHPAVAQSGVWVVNNITPASQSGVWSVLTTQLGIPHVVIDNHPPVSQSGQWIVQNVTPASQSGVWTVQPGNTGNTTPWLVSNVTPVAQSGIWTTSSVITNIPLPTIVVNHPPVIQSGQWIVQNVTPASQSGVWTVQPGNTQNLTPWLVSNITPVAQSGNWSTTINNIPLPVIVNNHPAVSQSGQWIVQNITPASQSGVWTVQPGNTINTTPWLVSNITPVAQSGLWTTTSVISNLPLPVVVNNHPAVSQSGQWIVQNITPASQSGVWTVQPGNTGNLTPWLVSNITPVAQSGIWNVNTNTVGVPHVVVDNHPPVSLSGINHILVDNLPAVSQSGIWTVQPGNTPNTVPWLVDQAQGDPWSVLNLTPVSQSGQWIVQNITPVAQSGVWIVQPGNTPNTTPWLTTISQGGNSVLVDGTGALKVAATVNVLNSPVTQSGQWIVQNITPASQSGVWNVGLTGSILATGNLVQADFDTSLSGIQNIPLVGIAQPTNSGAMIAGTTANPLSVVSIPGPLNTNYTTSNITGNGQTIILTASGCVDFGVVITGAWTGTLQIEGSVDGVNYVGVFCFSSANQIMQNSTTVNDTLIGTCGGLGTVRVRASAFASGTATISIRSEMVGGVRRIAGHQANAVLPVLIENQPTNAAVDLTGATYVVNKPTVLVGTSGLMYGHVFRSPQPYTAGSDNVISLTTSGLLRQEGVYIETTDTTNSGLGLGIDYIGAATTGTMVGRAATVGTLSPLTVTNSGYLKVSVQDDPGYIAYTAPIQVAVSGLSVNTTYFSMRNLGTRNVYIRRLYLQFLCAVAAANTSSFFDVRRFTIATPTAGNTITIIKKDSSAPNSTITDIREANSGLTTTNVTFEPPIWSPGCVTQPATLQILDMFSNYGEHALMVLRPNEGLCIRSNTTIVSGIQFTGFIDWDER